MNPTDDIVFFWDVDDTLFDSDSLIEKLKAHVQEILGLDDQEQYWEIFNKARQEMGYVDYLGALQKYREANPHDQRCLQISRFLLQYPLSSLLYPGALAVLAHTAQFGTNVILTDGDVVFQPHKIERSGLMKAVEDRVLIYIHKDQELADIERHYPARHYVLIDDKARILRSVKQQWGQRVTTVLPRQGHYANEPDALTQKPGPDLLVSRIQTMITIDKAQFIKSSKPGH